MQRRIFLGAAALGAYKALAGPPIMRDKTQSPQWNGTKFVNAEPTESAGFGALPRIAKIYQQRPKGYGLPKHPIPVRKLDPSEWAVQPAQALRYWWLGHSSFVLEMDGHRIITDPVLGQRASPVSFLGPKRLHEAPLPPAELPIADVVLLSHDHYDHLDKPTIIAYAQRGKAFVCPLGVAAYLVEWGVPKDRIHELDWWEKVKIGSLEITATPARHFSGRGLARDRTLWAGYVVEARTQSLYFTGDSGETQHFAEIGKRFTSLDYAILPIGAYNREWHDIHTDPAEAIAGFKALGAQLFIPCHWATFDLAPHSWADPGQLLEKLSNEYDITVAWPAVGEAMHGKPVSGKPWWYRCL